MPWGLAIGATVGLAKDQLVDVPREHKQRTLAAATQRYAPWTGMQAGPIQPADPLGNTMQFGVAGAGVGAAVDNNKQWANAINAAKGMPVQTAPSAAPAGNPYQAPVTTQSQKADEVLGPQGRQPASQNGGQWRPMNSDGSYYFAPQQSNPWFMGV